jgi:hypothetical protein
MLLRTQLQILEFRKTFSLLILIICRRFLTQTSHCMSYLGPILLIYYLKRFAGSLRMFSNVLQPNAETLPSEKLCWLGTMIALKYRFACLKGLSQWRWRADKDGYSIPLRFVIIFRPELVIKVPFSLRTILQEPE